MDPYRTLPRLGPEVEPELDRVAVPFRVPVMRGGWIVVTPSTLRFEPRFGRAREAPIDGGVTALQLSPALDAELPAVEAWCHIVASGPYQQPLAHARRGVVEKANAHSLARGVDERRMFTAIIDGDRLLAIEAAPALDVCFQLRPALPRSGALLGRALAWVGNEVFAELLGRLRGQYRVFTRTQVRDRPAYSVEDRRFELLGTSSRDAVAIEPSLAESMMLAHWVAGGEISRR